MGGTGYNGRRQPARAPPLPAQPKLTLPRAPPHSPRMPIRTAHGATITTGTGTRRPVRSPMPG